VVWNRLLQFGENAPAICLKLIGKAQLHRKCIDKNTDVWVVVLVSALRGASIAEYVIQRHSYLKTIFPTYAAALAPYPGMTRLRM